MVEIPLLVTNVRLGTERLTKEGSMLVVRIAEVEVIVVGDSTADVVDWGP